MKQIILTGSGIPEAGVSHTLFHPLPTCSTPLNSNLINLAAQSLAFFSSCSARSCRLDFRSPTDKSLCCSRCKSASAHAPKQALSSAWCTSGPKLTSCTRRHKLWEHAQQLRCGKGGEAMLGSPQAQGFDALNGGV